MVVTASATRKKASRPAGLGAVTEDQRREMYHKCAAFWYSGTSSAARSSQSLDNTLRTYVLVVVLVVILESS